MKRRRLLMRTSILVVIVLALAYTFYLNFISDRSIVKAGDESINFVLTDLKGEKIELESLRGKGVFLNFWGTYCPPCEKEMPIMEDLYPLFKAQGIEIIAVNVNEPELTVQKFVNRYKLSFPIAIDKNDLIVDAYGINPLPTTVLIDEHGKVVHVHQGGMNEVMIRSFMEKIRPGT